jgi:hypothetical protein
MANERRDCGHQRHAEELRHSTMKEKHQAAYFLCWILTTVTCLFFLGVQNEPAHLDTRFFACTVIPPFERYYMLRDSGQLLAALLS